MGRNPKEKPNKKHPVQPKWIMQRNPFYPVGHEYLSHLLDDLHKSGRITYKAFKQKG